MNSRAICFAAAAGALVVCSAAGTSDQAAPSAAPAASTPAPAAQASATDPNRVICRDRVATGSRLSYARDCHTQMEWDVIARTSREYINGQQMKGFEAGKPCGKTC
ncbi:MAG: hypothetical protein ACJ8EL_01060 [Rhizomicrobium sp.]|jgi:hypothetical protein